MLCPGGAYDRSPCGSGASAKVACLAADGTLAPGAVLPAIHGRAHVTLDATVIIDPADPFEWGLA